MGRGHAPSAGWRWSRFSPRQQTEYTCPMHPEIVRERPGSCPICGMALEPRTITAAEEPNPELIDMTRRFWIATALAVPVLALAMVPTCSGLKSCRPHSANGSSWCWRRRSCCGRVAVLRARLGLDSHRQSEHVHADRARRRGRLPLQPGGHAAARRLSRFASAMHGVVRRLLRDGRGDHHPGPARPGAGAARAQPDRQRHPGACSAWRRRRPASSATTAPKKTSRSSRSPSATGCASGPAKRCRSTASSSKAPARSTNR